MNKKLIITIFSVISVILLINVINMIPSNKNSRVPIFALPATKITNFLNKEYPDENYFVVYPTVKGDGPMNDYSNGLNIFLRNLSHVEYAVCLPQVHETDNLVLFFSNNDIEKITPFLKKDQIVIAYSEITSVFKEDLWNDSDLPRFVIYSPSTIYVSQRALELVKENKIVAVLISRNDDNAYHLTPETDYSKTHDYSNLDEDFYKKYHLITSKNVLEFERKFPASVIK